MSAEDKAVFTLPVHGYTASTSMRPEGIGCKGLTCVCGRERDESGLKEGAHEGGSDRHKEEDGVFSGAL